MPPDFGAIAQMAKEVGPEKQIKREDSGLRPEAFHENPPQTGESTHQNESRTPIFTTPSFQFQVSAQDGDDTKLKIPPDSIDGSKLHQPTPTRRPSLGQIFSKRVSLSSRKASIPRAVSPTPSHRSGFVQSPAPTIIPDISTENLWDDIDTSRLSIDYFKATMRKFAKPDKSEPQACLDFSMLHFINIRHLEALLFAEVNWFNEAIEKVPEDDLEDKKHYFDELSPQFLRNIELRYPARLKSIQSLLHQYSNAVRDFEDMRKRKVKQSIDFNLSAQDPNPRPRRPSRLLGRYRTLSGSLSSSAPIDEEAATTSTSTPPLRPGKAPRANSDPNAIKALHHAATVMRAVNHLGRPINLAQRRSERQLRLRLSHREIAGVEDWSQDFHLHSTRQKSEHEQRQAEQVEALRRDIRRFGMAVAGGIALIVPVVIMSENQELRWSLVTTSVATLLFAGMMTAFSKAEEKDILTATAAYAAVLVVFVGTTLPNGGRGGGGGSGGVSG